MASINIVVNSSPLQAEMVHLIHEFFTPIAREALASLTASFPSREALASLTASFPFREALASLTASVPSREALASLTASVPSQWLVAAVHALTSSSFLCLASFLYVVGCRVTRAQLVSTSVSFINKNGNACKSCCFFCDCMAFSEPPLIQLTLLEVLTHRGLFHI